jgi:hypothetical protein
MTTHLVTFADESMSRAAELCVESAGRNGVDDAQGGWASECIYDRHAIEFSGWSDGPQLELLELMDANPRGCGFWAWKPFVIIEAMNHCAPGDILIYSDAGVEFINNVNYIIDRMGHEKPQDDIFLFGNNWEHAHWCKRDVIEAIWPWWERGRPTLYQGDEIGDRVVNVFVDDGQGSSIRRDIEIRELAWERFHKQCQASVIFFRVSDYTRQFVAEWLKWCLFEGGRLIDDSPSRAPNHPEFQEHRHDQAILTTLAYREGIRLHYWPAVYNKGGSPEFVYEKLPEYAGDDYPILFHHHRRRNHEWTNPL